MVSRDPRTKVHQSQRLSVDWPDPYRCQISSLRQDVSNICAPRKRGSEFTKIAKDLLRTNGPSLCKIRPNNVREKRYSSYFYTFSIFNLLTNFDDFVVSMTDRRTKTVHVSASHPATKNVSRKKPPDC